MGHLGVFRLTPAIKHYDWGKLKHGLVWRFAGCPDVEKPFAEAWFGAHPKGKAYVEGQGGAVPLDECLQGLPANLLKVLSIAKPLSIQLHPGKELAGKLHRSFPELYPDVNAKAEMALALSDTKLLCGFRPKEKLFEDASQRKSFASLIELVRPEESEGYFSSLLRNLFNERKDKLSPILESLISEIRTSPKPHERALLSAVDFFGKGDLGLFFFYFLNYVELPPGKSVSVQPGVPHAYLSGEIVEAQVTSDNVIRAGLTSKHCDPEALVEALSDSRQSTKVEAGAVLNESPWRVHHHQSGEFSLAIASSDANNFELPLALGPQIILVLGGEGQLKSKKGALDFTGPSAFLRFPEAKEVTLHMKKPPATPQVAVAMGL